jgi:prolyl oligopeptidase PreP (S9A serine peptidase family)
VAHLQAHDNDSKGLRATDEERKDDLEAIQKLSEELGRTNEIRPGDVRPAHVSTAGNYESNEAFLARRKAEKLKRTESGDSAEGLWQKAEADVSVSNSDLPSGDSNAEKSMQEISKKSSTQYLNIPNCQEKSLSITIPGAFA